MHTGEPSRVRIVPSENDHLAFVSNGNRLPAVLDQVAHTSRCTTLGATPFQVSTVEHLMAALSAFSIAGADLYVEGPEVPILDGSAAQIVRLLREAGLRRLPGTRRVLRLSHPVWLEEGTSSLLAVPSDHFRLTTTISFDHPMVGRQITDVVVDPESFERDIAPARTFGFEEELVELERNGLARGGSIENALVFRRSSTTSPLRFPDEPVRHKAMDVIGDLALLGALPLTHIFAIRPSHRLNIEFGRLLARHGCIE